MKDMNKDLELYQRFRKLSEKLKRYAAFTYVLELWENPGRPINPIQLYTLYQDFDEVNVASSDEDIYLYTLPMMNYRLPERNIAFTDNKTIYQVKKALNATRIIHAREKANRNLARAADLQWQIDQMVSYLYKALTFNGKIRNVGDITQRYYLLVYRAYTSLLKALNRIDPELATYIQNHVKIASMCYWLEEPIITGKRKKRKKQAAIIIMEDDAIVYADGQRPA